MMEWPLIAIAGLLGSAHCLGMCGPFALLIASGATGRCDAANRQVVFSIGRLTTYAFLGAFAGLGGAWIAHYRTGLIRTSALMALFAGTLLVVQGLSSLGLMRRGAITDRSGVLCLAARGYRSLLAAPGLGPVLVAGLLTGFLPCGLLYGMLALAASTHSVLIGASVMVTFGLGTVPALWCFGWTSGSFSAVWRARVWRAAAVAILLTGLVTIGRGVTALAATTGGPRGGVCPWCGGTESLGSGTSRVSGGGRHVENGGGQSDAHDDENTDQ